MENRRASAGIMEAAAFRYVMFGLVALLALVVLILSDFKVSSAYASLKDAFPRIRECVSAFFTPAYMYIFVNCIIVIILVNSGFPLRSRAEVSSFKAEVSQSSTVSSQLVDGAECSVPSEPSDVYQIASDTNLYCAEYESSGIQKTEIETNFKSRDDFQAPSTEKPPVRKRFDKKAVRSSSDIGISKKINKSKPKDDTLEATWKAITEGRQTHPPLTRHQQLKKAALPEDDYLDRNFKKSETWPANDRVENAAVSSSSPSLKKQPSPSQDELNRRVEAFIAKVNNDMRLQREQSIARYHELLNRGAS
eukprot:TRINITY_DN25774_c0_g1_i1.p1 TRINITY_DN25774_c0_g1~~TRINITY_DN25774_c0_g1_i1.p1  ORF type:complete len:345 (+),score=28.00 TRINITY_DN25774_c0_g1_i1:117-1037(+)